MLNNTPIRVTIDTREQRPCPFPRSIRVRLGGFCYEKKIVLTKAKLVAGDYALTDLEWLAGVETKRSLSELWKNFMTGDLDRCRVALDRLAGLRHGALMLQIPVGQAFKSGPHIRQPTRILDTLMAETTLRGLDLLWVPPSNVVEPGEIIARYLIQCSYNRYRYGENSGSNHKPVTEETDGKQPEET